MNRRGFLQFSAAATALALLPPIAPAPSAEAMSLDIINKVVWQMKAQGGEDYYVVFMHPNQYQQLRDIEAREWWRYEWRRQRLAAKGIIEPKREPAIGQWTGVRVIEEVG